MILEEVVQCCEKKMSRVPDRKLVSDGPEAEEWTLQVRAGREAVTLALRGTRGEIAAMPQGVGPVTPPYIAGHGHQKNSATFQARRLEARVRERPRPGRWPTDSSSPRHGAEAAQGTPARLPRGQLAPSLRGCWRTYLAR